jgi:hypothetical protein
MVCNCKNELDAVPRHDASHRSISSRRQAIQPSMTLRQKSGEFKDALRGLRNRIHQLPSPQAMRTSWGLRHRHEGRRPGTWVPVPDKVNSWSRISFLFTITERGAWTTEYEFRENAWGHSAVDESQTTTAIQRYINELAGVQGGRSRGLLANTPKSGNFP